MSHRINWGVTRHACQHQKSREPRLKKGEPQTNNCVLDCHFFGFNQHNH